MPGKGLLIVVDYTSSHDEDAIESRRRLRPTLHAAKSAACGKGIRKSAILRILQKWRILQIMNAAQIIEADWTWMHDRFHSNVRVAIGQDGRIAGVGALPQKPTQRLGGCALLPGMINAHSHAFQRGLRGRGESFPHGAGSFWTWREAMYGLVVGMDAPTLYGLCHHAFAEMLSAGVTTVGEFHYLHHDVAGQGYEFDEVVVRAAADAGIRLVLLNAYYHTGGIGQGLSPAQGRFASDSVDAFFQHLDRLASRIEPRTQHLGMVAHSIRAAPLKDIAALHERAKQEGMVLHMHVEEQRKEIADCQATYNAPPMQLLNGSLKIDERFTAVHCTHTAKADIQRFLSAGGNVCLCPLTEANLGDGIADVPAMLAQDGHICIGTDSNSRICMTEEMRWLEYVQRLKTESRGVCVDASGSVAKTLWRMATLNGARSLGLDAGRIETGALADLIAIDLSAPSLAGWTPDTLLDAFIFGTGGNEVVATCVGGKWRGRDAQR